ncbi:hypothetical protein ABID70_000329 [Clavibacter michiganensis]
MTTARVDAPAPSATLATAAPRIDDDVSRVGAPGPVPVCVPTAVSPSGAMRGR